jgi:hypothetical protein
MNIKNLSINHVNNNLYIKFICSFKNNFKTIIKVKFFLKNQILKNFRIISKV